MKYDKDTHRITITVSGDMLREIDSRIPDRRAPCRQRFILDLLEDHLYPGQRFTGLGEKVAYNALGKNRCLKL